MGTSSHLVFWLLPVLVLVLGGAQWVMPLRMRPGLWFAVTVPRDFEGSSVGVRVLRGYRLGVLLGSAGALGLLGLARWTDHGWLVVVAVLLQQGAVLVAFLLGRRRVLPHAMAEDTSREAMLGGHDGGLPGGEVAQLGPFAVLAAVALWLHARADTAAERLALGTEGSRYELLLAVLFCALLAGVSWALRRGARRGVPVEGSRWDFRQVVRGVLLGAEYLVAIQSAGALWAAGGGPGWARAALGGLAWAFAVGVIVLLSVIGQGGARGSPPPVRGDRTRDAFWKWGLVYVNPEDPALFIEKRFGLGYTLNFGNRWAWVTLAALLVFPLVARLMRG